jgi:uncharacterized tellurite resistance protein B-like protein
MSLQRFLGRPGRPAPASGPEDQADTETVRRIVRELEALAPDRARFLASFAYTLTRAAAADLQISEVEASVIERIVREYGGLPEAQAVLVAEIARTQQLLAGGTEDYVVTRQFRELATPAERIDLLRCCYLVGAADDSISTEESTILQQVAHELDVDRSDVNAIRAEFAGKLSIIQAWFAEPAAGAR